VITFEPTSLPIDLPDLRAMIVEELDPELQNDALPVDLCWWLGGRRAHVDFDAAGGLVGARFGTHASLGALDWPNAPVVRVSAAPRAARFTRSGSAGALQETIRIPERLPGLLIELRASPGTAIDADSAVDPGSAESNDTAEAPRVGHLTLQLPDGPVGTASDKGVRWFEAGEGEGLLIVALGSDGRRSALGEPIAMEGGALLPISMAGDALTLLVLAGEPASSSLRSLAAGRAHQLRSAPAKEALRLREPTGETAGAIEWAWTRMRDRSLTGVGPMPPLADGDAAVWVRTAIAAGLPDAARAVLSEAPTTVAEADAWEAWAASVGAGGPLDRLEKRIGGGETLPSEVRSRLADVADRAASETWAGKLRATEASEAGRVALPSVGGASATPDAPGDEATAHGAGQSEAKPGAGPGIGRGTTAGEWLSHTSADPAALDAYGWRLLSGLIEGVLGWSPDAASGRMHLTPTLPDAWPRFAVEGLRGGELRMRLERIREGGEERWRFEPMAGAVPATLILRLPVPDRDTPVEVDGVAAELDYDRTDGVLRVPIQIELDRERTVRVGGTTGQKSPGARRISLPTL